MSTRKSRLISIFSVFLILTVSSHTISSESLPGESRNKAVQVEIVKESFTSELAGIKAPDGKIFLVLETRWENIHPQKKVEKDKLEGKTDRTMGVGALGGRKKKTKTEYVDVDVAYQIGRFYDHAYCLANGLAYSLHNITEDIPEGTRIREAFTIPKKGDLRKVNLVYLIPESAKNLGFQFFDYTYGHISIPVQGDFKIARGTGEPSENALGSIKSKLIEIAAHSVSFHDQYKETTAPDGWRYAVVQISGKSLSGSSVKDILQIEPEEYTWVATEGGYFYYAAGGSTTEQGMIRFTPEIFQYQELVFLVPGSSHLSQLGVRIRNDVFQINVSEGIPQKIPEPIATHLDGDVMEIKLYGVKKDNGSIILDLGIQSLSTSGIEIQKKQQFILNAGGEQISINEEITDSLFHRPPTPFLLPPKTFVRFELAYETGAHPDSLYFRGYQSETTLKLPSID